ncbi:hypothetical protein VARIO8X_120040 [Burkholderiales bacterium 8X]|nr:hypothetical protein VARIO8X_120040 [Burkholderiales bacterium 8X]
MRTALRDEVVFVAFVENVDNALAGAISRSAANISICSS